MPMVKLLKKVYEDLGYPPCENITDTEFYDKSMTAFRRLHVKLGIPKEFITRYLKIGNNICATEADKTFLYIFFKGSAYMDAVKKSFSGTVNEKTAEDFVWKVDGLYGIYLHLFTYKNKLEENRDNQEIYLKHEEILLEIEKAITEKTNYPYWKEKIIGEKLIRKIRSKIDEIVIDKNLKEKQKKQSLMI